MMFSLLLFTKCDIDILGAFPKLTEQHKFLSMAVDYFTKRVKVGESHPSLKGKFKSLVGRTSPHGFGGLTAMVFENG